MHILHVHEFYSEATKQCEKIFCSGPLLVYDTDLLKASSQSIHNTAKPTIDFNILKTDTVIQDSNSENLLVDTVDTLSNMNFPECINLDGYEKPISESNEQNISSLMLQRQDLICGIPENIASQYTHFSAFYRKNWMKREKYFLDANNKLTYDRIAVNTLSPWLLSYLKFFNDPKLTNGL